MIEAKLPDDFDAKAYLKLNEDVAKAGVDPEKHYLEHGFFEARRYRENQTGCASRPRQRWHERVLGTLSTWVLGHENIGSYDAFRLSCEPSYKHTTYFSVYDKLLSQYRGRPITFVEVGVLNGGSLFMWRRFFGKKARIIGVDLNPGARKWESHGFEIFIGNQADPQFWDNLFEQIGDVDVLLDDGGHRYVQQIVTAECCLNHIRDGGMLIVEDTHTSYMDGFGESETSFYEYLKRLSDKMNMRFGEFDDRSNDRRVWSMEMFESIVALKINHSATKEKSRPIWNLAPDQIAQDFRSIELDETTETLAARRTILERAFDSE